MPSQLEAIPCPASPHHPRGACCGKHRVMIGHLEDYLFIGGDRLSASQAARRLGVTTRTICRWRALLRQVRQS